MIIEKKRSWHRKVPFISHAIQVMMMIPSCFLKEITKQVFYSREDHHPKLLPFLCYFWWWSSSSLPFTWTWSCFTGRSYIASHSFLKLLIWFYFHLLLHHNSSRETVGRLSLVFLCHLFFRHFIMKGSRTRCFWWWWWWYCIFISTLKLQILLHTAYT